MLSHPSSCEQAGAQPGCADPDPHKLCTSLPSLDGGTGEITAPLSCSAQAAQLSPARSGLPGLAARGLAVGGPETLGDFGPHGPHSARNSLAERSLPSAAGTVLGPTSWSDARKDRWRGNGLRGNVSQVRPACSLYKGLGLQAAFLGSPFLALHLRPHACKMG